MKKFLGMALFALLISPAWAAEAVPVAGTPATAPVVRKVKETKSLAEAGIKKTFDAISDAWAKGDAKAVASHFLKEGSLINPFGQEAWNRKGIETLLASDLSTIKGSTQTFDNFKFHFVLGEFALVDLTGTLSGLKNADGSPASDMSVHAYAAMAQRGLKWYILALRPYVFVKPAGQTAAPVAQAPAVEVPAAVPTVASVPTKNVNTRIPVVK